MQTESIKKAAPTVVRVKVNEMSKQKPKMTGLEDWQKRKSHLKRRSAIEEKEIEFLNCATKLGKNILDNKEEGIMSK